MTPKKISVRLALALIAFASLPAQAQVSSFSFDTYKNGQPVPSSATGTPIAGNPIANNGGPLLQVDGQVKLAACVKKWVWAKSQPNVLIGATGTLSGNADSGFDTSGVVCDSKAPVRLRLRTPPAAFVGFFIIGKNPGGWRVKGLKPGELDDPNNEVVVLTVPADDGARRWVSVVDSGRNIANVWIEAIPGQGPIGDWGVDDVSWAR